MDGLKIEPLPYEISGVDAKGQWTRFRPIRDISEIYERLDERVMAGFGGVPEYGITVRGNKNFLKVIRPLIERRRESSMYGGVGLAAPPTPAIPFYLPSHPTPLCAAAAPPPAIPPH